MKLRHIGLYWTIYHLQQSNISVTTQYLVELTGEQRKTLLKITSNLVDIGILKRRQIKGPHGKGRAWEYYAEISEEVAAKIIADQMKSMNASFNPTVAPR